MPLRRLYCPSLSQGSVVLSGEEAHHAIASLRARAGQDVVLFDGAGREAVAVIARVAGRRLHMNVTGITERPFELSHKITLAVAMTKTHRQGYLIEKCTELGVAAIWPIIADRSTSKPGAGAVEKWTRRAIEAAKQSGRAWVPTITAPRMFPESVARIRDFSAASLTQTGPSLAAFGTFLASQPADASVLVWVGPEGGWCEAEQEQAVKAGAVLTSLGPTVLRTETAAVAVCAAAAMHSSR